MNAITQNNPIYAEGIINVSGGGSVTTVLVNSRKPPSDLQVFAQGAISTWTIVLPNDPYDGQLIGIGAPGGAVTTLIISSPWPLGTLPPSSLSQGTYFVIQYSILQAQWVITFDTFGNAGGVSAVIVSTTQPPVGPLGSLWYNPTTQLLSITEVPSYAWSTNRSFGTIVVSNNGLTATRTDSSYPPIVTPFQAGAVTVSVLPQTQKYVLSITTSMNLAGNSGFGIGDDGQTLGDGLFLGDVTNSIGYYVEASSFYFFVNDAIPTSGASSIANGTYYIAVDPVAKTMWVETAPGVYNGNPSANPATGTGGVAFPLSIPTSRIIAQCWVNGDAATIDPTASGMTIPSGFLPLSQIIQWQPLSYINPSAISGGWVNIKDFGAVGDGVADDGAAFQAFTKLYQGQEVILYMPPGNYQSQSNTLGVFDGIKSLTIIGYGAELGFNITIYGGATNTWTTATSALVQSAHSGDVSLILVNPSDASKFSAGMWIMLGALDIQSGGIPPNMHYMQFVQITTISAGVVYLDNYVVGGPYLSTYPYYTNNSSGVNEGGPATIWVMPSTWDADVYCLGLTFNGGNNMPVVRNVYYRDCQWPGLNTGNYPQVSQAKQITFDNCIIQGGGSIEIDKDVELLTFKNCRIIGYYTNLLFQSSSIQKCIIDGCLVDSIQGTPKSIVIRDSIIYTLQPTPRSDGITESIELENSYIGYLQSTNFGAGFGNAEPISNYTFANGTFTKANTGAGAYVGWACPGAKCVFQDVNGGSFFLSPPFFTVLNVRGDPGDIGTGNVYIDTTLSSIPSWTQGGFPNNIPLPGVLAQHPYARITIKNCRGDPNVMAWQSGNNPNATEGPGFRYAEYLMAGDCSPVPANGNMHAVGTLTTINVNVLRAYTGANSSEHLLSQQFEIYNTSFAGVVPSFSVNLKVAGLRTWSAGSWTGSQTGDTLPTIGAGSWLLGYIKWYYDNAMGSDNLGQMPLVLIQIVTDQGIIENDIINYAGSIFPS